MEPLTPVNGAAGPRLSGRVWNNFTVRSRVSVARVLSLLSHEFFPLPAMAAATPGGDSVGGGGDSVGGHSQAGSGADTSPRVDGADGAAVGASRGYSPVEGGPHPLEVRAAVAFAKAVMSSPAKSSYQLCSALGPVE